MGLDILCITSGPTTLPLHEQALSCFTDKKYAVLYGLGQLNLSSDKPFTSPKLMLIEAEYVGTLNTLAIAFPTTYGWVRNTPLVILQSQAYSVAHDPNNFNVIDTIPIEETTNADSIRARIDIFDLANRTKKGAVVTPDDYANARAAYTNLPDARSKRQASRSDPFPKKL